MGWLKGKKRGKQSPEHLKKRRLSGIGWTLGNKRPRVVRSQSHKAKISITTKLVWVKRKGIKIEYRYCQICGIKYLFSKLYPFIKTNPPFKPIKIIVCKNCLNNN